MHHHQNNTLFGFDKTGCLGLVAGLGRFFGIDVERILKNMGGIEHPPIDRSTVVIEVKNEPIVPEQIIEKPNTPLEAKTLEKISESEKLSKLLASICLAKDYHDHVLIVDDTSANLAAAKGIFKKAETASNPLEAMEKIQGRATPYKLIITDMKMDGNEHAGNILIEYGREHSIPTIMISGGGGTGHIIDQELSIKMSDSLGNDVIELDGLDFADKADPKSWEFLDRALKYLPKIGDIHDGILDEYVPRKGWDNEKIPMGLTEEDIIASLHHTSKGSSICDTESDIVPRSPTYYRPTRYAVIRGQLEKVQHKYELDAGEKLNSYLAGLEGISLSEFLNTEIPKGDEGRHSKYRNFYKRVRGHTKSLKEQTQDPSPYGFRDPHLLWRCGDYDLYEQDNYCWGAYGDRMYRSLFVKFGEHTIPLIGRTGHVMGGTGFEVIEFRRHNNGVRLVGRNKYDDEHTRGDNVHIFEISGDQIKESSTMRREEYGKR